ncbi:unnamed protein product [Didymodactylos carnosus]|uniref:Uncharacterized protein n=1 Tax=Didymodactylos carnosus TaxID=1234261 RepID=A0A814ZTD0_9BILA|nr:unnamed protein product [Didymodactylos carnosus]CAF4018275.1 unnamed protein product [Didymodactylos carnosus]
MIRTIPFFGFYIYRNYDILLIDWHSAIEIGLNAKYSGTLSTASNFVLNKLAKDTNTAIQCFPTDDYISLMKMILLEIISKEFNEAVLSKVKQASYTGIIGVYEQIEMSYRNRQPIIFKVIQFLEEYRNSLNGEKLNNYIDECIKKRQCLFELQNQQSDIDYFYQLEKNLFSS